MPISLELAALLFMNSTAFERDGVMNRTYYDTRVIPALVEFSTSCSTQGSDGCVVFQSELHGGQHGGFPCSRANGPHQHRGASMPRLRVLCYMIFVRRLVREELFQVLKGAQCARWPVQGLSRALLCHSRTTRRTCPRRALSFPTTGEPSLHLRVLSDTGRHRGPTRDHSFLGLREEMAEEIKASHYRLHYRDTLMIAPSSPFGTMDSQPR